MNYNIHYWVLKFDIIVKMYGIIKRESTKGNLLNRGISQISYYVSIMLKFASVQTNCLQDIVC